MDTGAFAPTHEVPEPGIPAWAAPDPSQPAVTELGARLPVAVAERAGQWARVVCSNGWTGWVDGGRLVATSAPAPAPPAAQWDASAGRSEVFNPEPTIITPAPAPAPGGYPPPGGYDPSRVTILAPAAGAAPRSSRGVTVTKGGWIALAGAAVMIISGFIGWLSVTASFGGSSDFNGYDTPAHFLLDNHSSPGGLSVGVLVLVLGVLTAIAAVRRPYPFALIGGILAIGVAGLFVYQVNDTVQQVNDRGASASLSDFLAAGAYVAAAGGVAAIVGALVDRRS